MTTSEPQEGWHKARREIRETSDVEQSVTAQLEALTAKYAADSSIDWQVHSHLTLSRQSLSRILYYDTLYRLVVDVPGVICEFGVQWGATMALLTNLRGIHEPYNHKRHVIGFDTFEGFPSVHVADGSAPEVGDYAVAGGHEADLREILALHELSSPIQHISKSEVVKGDVSRSFPAWLHENPQAVIAMAIFDMDIYEPTRVALEAVLPRLTKGSLLVFDELNTAEFPGETLALREVLGLDRLRLRNFPHQPGCAYAVWGE
jgi:hypothetical protein